MELKFRAWDKFNDCFHYPASESTASLAKFFTQMADMQAAGNGIIITQYTGQKTKDGVEIYVGDKVTTSVDEGVIIFFEQYSSFMIDCDGILFNVYETESVIGNIFSAVGV